MPAMARGMPGCGRGMAASCGGRGQTDPQIGQARPRLAAAKLRAPLGDERRNALLRIVGAAGGDDRLLFRFQLVGKAGLERLSQHATDGAVGARRAGGERRGEGERLSLDGIIRCKTRYQSERLSLLRRQATVE